MENILYYNNLFDYYGELLTETQRNYFIAYYFDNYSLNEIAENYNVSKTAIGKTLKEVKEKLDTYEEVMNLYQKKEKIKKVLDQNTFKKIEDYI